MTGLGGDSFWLCWDARAARLTALQAARRARRRARRRSSTVGTGSSQIPARGPLAALTVPGAPTASDRAHASAGSGSARRCRGEICSRRRSGTRPTASRLAVPVARHGRRGRPPRRHRMRAFAPVPRDLSGRRRGAGARAAARPAGARAHSRARSPARAGRAFYEEAIAAEIEPGVRGDRELAARADLAAHRSRLDRAGHGAVPRRARGHGPAAVPGTGCARGAGDARRGRTSARALATRPTTSTSPSRRRSSPSVTGTAGSPTRSMPRCRSVASSIRPISGTAGRRIAMDRAAPRRSPRASSAVTRSPASRPTRPATACR